MKWPSRRNSLPNGTLSWTSTSWNADRNFSSTAADRMKKPQSSVMYSVIAPGARSPPGSGILPAAVNGLEPRSPRLQHRLELAEYSLSLRGVVGRVIADVDVDGHEARFRPRVDGEVRFGEQHRPGDALRLELVEVVADDR